MANKSEDHREPVDVSQPQKELALAAWASLSKTAAEMAEADLKAGNLPDAQACINMGYAAAQAYGIIKGTYEVGPSGGGGQP